MTKDQKLVYCKFCDTSKLENEFAPSQLKINNPQCRKCVKIYHSKYYQENKEKIAEQGIQYRQENKDEIKIKKQKHYVEHKEEKARYYQENKDEIAVRMGRYYQKNKKEITEQQSRYQAKRRKNDLIFKLRRNVSRSINRILKFEGSSKSNLSILSFLTYSIQELKQHIEKQFQFLGNEWMNWDNWGVYDPKTWNDNDPSTWTWQLDHIIPQSDLPYTTMEEENFKKCWALSNLRPLSAKQNHSDGASRVRHGKKIPSHNQNQ